MEQRLLIGIDGGGTHSTAVAVWPDGRVAAAVSGGGCNYHHAGADTVRQRMADMVRALCGRAGAPAGEICVGMSALDGPADADTLRMFECEALPPGRLDLQSDAYIALMGLTRGGPGMMVICGTGSMLLLTDAAGGQHVSGGWGYLLDDAGSGYSLARDALLAAAAEADGVGPATALTGLALGYFGVKKPRELIDAVYAPQNTPDRMAGFARSVLEAAAADEPEARRILRGNMARLARLAASLLSRSPGVRTLGLYGGVFAHSEAARAAFSEALTAQVPDADIRTPEYPPELGAVIHLMRREGILTGEALAGMKKTYEEIKP